MDGSDFDIEQPPFAQLDEALWWIEFRHIGESARDGWWSTFESKDRLEAALLANELRAYGSIDASPVQQIERWTWTEFDFVAVDRAGREIQTKAGGPIHRFIVRSLKAYRAAALKDLSQPTKELVPGISGEETGFHRVMDQIVFLESDVRRAFPAGLAPAKEYPPLDKKYPTFLKEIEDGKYLYSPEPVGFDHVFGLLIDYLKRTRQLNSADNSVRKGLQRHYKEFSKHGQ
ncbi:hypothetical protein [Bradyrhizobium sp. DASA03007]|uniref:hypothetical protein n=1 Tax=unclassified Bradyrhizobium TaxID=2631580 RepID=UPI003F716FC9